MDDRLKLKRGGTRLPKSRIGVPPVPDLSVARPTIVPLHLKPPELVVTRKLSGRGDLDYNELNSRLEALSISFSSEPAPHNSAGRDNTISLETNFFEMTYPENLVLYDYTIKVEPDICKEYKDVRRALFYHFENSNELAPFIHGIVHDGSHRLISIASLPSNLSIKTESTFEDFEGHASVWKTRLHTFHLLFQKELKLADLTRYLRGDDPCYDPQAVISALNLILTSYAGHACFRTGRPGFYYHSPSMLLPSKPPMFLSPVLEAWRGFSATVKPLHNKLMVNIRTALGPFYVQNARLSDVLINLSIQLGCMMIAVKSLSRVRVATTYLGYRRSSEIKGFSSSSARTTFVHVKGLGELTLEQYFQQKYGIPLLHADNLPVVNIGTKTKDTFVPAELCRLEPGQSYIGALSRNENTVLSVWSSTSETAALFNLRMLLLNHNAPFLASFGIKIALRTTELAARTLFPPKLLCRSGQPPIANGVWSSRHVLFSKPAQPNDVLVLVMHNGADHDVPDDIEFQLRKIIMDLFMRCRSFGMKPDTALPPLQFLSLPRCYSGNSHPVNALRIIEEKISSTTTKPRLLLLFFPRKDAHLYNGVKAMCDIKFGIQALCILTSTLLNGKRRSPCLTSIAFKVNSKFGGVNHVLAPRCLQWLRKTMLVGIGMSNSGDPRLKKYPSVATVVASFDMVFMQYAASLSIQERNTETILNIKAMMIERLAHYRKHMQDLPERVIIFRGGISDSQITHVLQRDLSGLREAFGEFPSYNPKATYITCSNGHRTRFYSAEGTGGAPPAGTVIDHGVVGIRESSFYLKTHSEMQNTARSARYTILLDENQFRADVLQKGINDLCYLWAPAPKSASLVPPVLWMKRACKRGWLYLSSIMSQIEDEGLALNGEKQVMERVKELWGNGVHSDVKDTMFYI